MDPSMSAFSQQPHTTPVNPLATTGHQIDLQINDTAVPVSIGPGLMNVFNRGPIDITGNMVLPQPQLVHMPQVRTAGPAPSSPRPVVRPGSARAHHRAAGTLDSLVAGKRRDLAGAPTNWARALG